jgi:DNA polymerase-3 subunit delta'
VTTALHPWNEAIWARLVEGRGRLPHALLFDGPAGLGKLALAQRLAHSLLCLAPRADGNACGACKSCVLVAAGNHPDLHVIAPAEEGKGILIDQVRELSEFLALRPHTASHKVVLLAPAEAMNTYAANSLLKLLEEPPLASHLLLVSHQAARLPATVRSRCSRVDVSTPTPATSTEWMTVQGLSPTEVHAALDLADGAPLRALALLQSGFLAQRRELMADLATLAGAAGDPVACATAWKKRGTHACLTWLQTWTADLIRLATDPQAARLFNADLRIELQAQAQRLNLRKLFGFFEVVSKNKSLARESLDEQLLLEDSLVRWASLARQ